jgi:hypothetical protein
LKEEQENHLRGSKYPMIDAHLHVVNFTQDTPGGEALMVAMDQANVGRSVIFGLPVSKMWAAGEREAPDWERVKHSIL